MLLKSFGPPSTGRRVMKQLLKRLRSRYVHEIMRLVHFSDLHMFSLKGLKAGELFTKRLLGILNWYRKRRRLVDHSLVARFQQEMARLMPDHILFTGDLAHLGRRPEFQAALGLLDGLSSRYGITIVPGNHDFYIEKSVHDMEQILGGRFGLPFRLHGRGSYPAAISYHESETICLCSAFPCALHLALGTLGPAQLSALDELLGDAGSKGLFRTVILHHPPLPGLASRRRGLTDHRRFLEIVENRGCELVLFGHVHCRHRQVLETKTGRSLFLAAPALCSTDPRPDRAGGFYVLEVERAGGRWQVEVSDFRLSESKGGYQCSRGPEVKLAY